MSWRTTATHAEVACDFPGCDRTRGVPVSPNMDVHCAALVAASELAASEGWQADATSRRLDLCPQHDQALDALVLAFLEEARAEGCTADPAKVRAVVEKSLRKLSTTERAS